MIDLKSSALRYAERGWHVIPVHSVKGGGCSCGKADCPSPAKHPRTPHGLKDASLDIATIESWWSRWPDANIGIVTGAGSGIVVLDIDPRHGGDESLAQLIGLVGDMCPVLFGHALVTCDGGWSCCDVRQLL